MPVRLRDATSRTSCDARWIVWVPEGLRAAGLLRVLELGVGMPRIVHDMEVFLKRRPSYYQERGARIL
jgi:hypothetical protein